MFHEPLIALRGVVKEYPLITRPRDRLRAVGALLLGRSYQPGRRVLDGVSLTLHRGQAIGIVGENGAGKSTLLKLAAGVLHPNAGSVTTRGRVAAMLELGAGFHPDYTGRDNALLMATLMGMSRREARQRLPAIAAFADLGEDFHRPLRQYSSGMVVRLGFAVVTVLQPDVLISDEVLAVGDEAFQAKCLAWLDDYLSRGGSLLLCSHSVYHIQKLCCQACWLHQGRVRAQGDPHAVTQAYQAHLQTARQLPVVTSPADDCYRLRDLKITTGPDGEGVREFGMGDTLLVQGEIQAPDDAVPHVAVGLVRADGTAVFGTASDMAGFVPTRVAPGLYGFILEFPDLPLLPGEYRVRAHAMDTSGLGLWDTLERPFRVVGQTREMGLCRLTCHWRERQQKVVPFRSRQTS